MRKTWGTRAGRLEKAALFIVRDPIKIRRLGDEASRPLDYNITVDALQPLLYRVALVGSFELRGDRRPEAVTDAFLLLTVSGLLFLAT